jgi:hypothetical protein
MTSPAASRVGLGASAAGERTTAQRSIWPREHGAYGQLGTPLVAALAMGRPGLAAIALTVAGSLAFVAHEALLVLAGQRGRRARREHGARAMRFALGLGGGAAILGTLALVAAPEAARIALGVPVALAALLGVFIARGAERTTGGEIVAAFALSSFGVPVALSSGVSELAAWGAWIVWCVGFGTATASVRAALANRRAPVSLARRLVPSALGALVILVLVTNARISIVTAVAALPMLLLSAGVGYAAPHPRAMRKVGWSFVASSIATLVVLVVGAHA